MGVCASELPQIKGDYRAMRLSFTNCGGHPLLGPALNESYSGWGRANRTQVVFSQLFRNDG